jgi:haloalkane dehalogenase
MEAYRTPDTAFGELPDFGREPSYAEVAAPDGGALRMAYVDAGPASGPVALLLHQGDYTHARLLERTRELAFDHLGRRHSTLVGRDWGGLIGLRLVAEHPDQTVEKAIPRLRFIRVVAADTGLQPATCRRPGGNGRMFPPPQMRAQFAACRTSAMRSARPLG